FLLFFVPMPRMRTFFPYTTLFRSGRRGYRDCPYSPLFTRVSTLVDNICHEYPAVYRRVALFRKTGHVLYIAWNGGIIVFSMGDGDRKSTRLNSSYVKRSYDVFSLK